MKVLVVDDSSTMRKIVRKTLTKMGVEDIVEAGNGQEALQQLADGGYQFDLVLCDVNMPEMDGFETLERIRGNAESAKIPVIMCTSVAEKDQIMRAIKAGANNYVVKPFRPDDLEKRITTTLEKCGKA